MSITELSTLRTLTGTFSIFFLKDVVLLQSMVSHSIVMIDPRKDQLPVGLISQLIENCAGIAEVRVGIQFRPFSLLLK